MAASACAFAGQSAADFICWLVSPALPQKLDPLELYRAHEAMAVKTADAVCYKFYRNGALTYKNDMREECRMMLWDRCRKYDPNKNDNFWLYALLWVRGAAYDLLRRERVILKNNKSDFTALTFVSGDNLISEKLPFMSDEPGGSHRFESFFDNMSSDAAPDTSHRAINARLDLARIMDRANLTDDERAALVGQMQGYYTKDIAKERGCTQPWIAMSLKSGLQKLQAALSDIKACGADIRRDPGLE